MSESNRFWPHQADMIGVIAASLIFGACLVQFFRGPIVRDREPTVTIIETRGSQTIIRQIPESQAPKI